MNIEAFNVTNPMGKFSVTGLILTWKTWHTFLYGKRTQIFDMGTKKTYTLTFLKPET